MSLRLKKYPLLFEESWSRVHKFLLFHWIDICRELNSPVVYILPVPRFVTGDVRAWGKDNSPQFLKIILNLINIRHIRQAYITCKIVRLLTFRISVLRTSIFAPVANAHPNQIHYTSAIKFEIHQVLICICLRSSLFRVTLGISRTACNIAYRV
jgi:hypothetical protein